MRINSILGLSNKISTVTQRNHNITYKYIPQQLGYDTVSFSGDLKILFPQEAEQYAQKYRTSTSGYRGEYGKDFNNRFVYTMTQAASKYMYDHKNTKKPKTIIGGDTREATIYYGPRIATLMRANGINVMYPKIEGSKDNIMSPVASPVLAVAAKHYQIPLSVLLTASHNPWKDGGYNFLTEKGMVADNTQTDEIAQNFINIAQEGKRPFVGFKERRKIYFDPYIIYKNYLDEKNFIDFENIRKSGIDIFYEDLCGTGKYYYPKLMSDHGIELKGILSTKTDGPNPTAENLVELGKAVKQSENPLRLGLATDGDSDRFGAVDENGNYINPNDFLTLIAYHLIKNKGMREGTIVKNHSTSDKLNALADYFNENGCNIDVKSTPVGFKYLGREMMDLEGTNKEIILAGESSGGLTIRGHIPEKDGFLAISLLAELVAAEKKPVSEILSEVNALINADYKSLNLNFKFPSEQQKLDAISIFEPYAAGEKDNFLGYKIDKEKTTAHNRMIKEYNPNGDGYKIYLQNKSSVLVRKSGTEPIMRYFIDSPDSKTLENLKQNLINYALGSEGEMIK